MKKLILLLTLIVLVPFFSFAAFPVEYDEKYDITEKDRAYKRDTYGISVSATRPIKPLKEFTLTYSFSKPVNSVKFTSNMEMNMGKFEYEGKKVTDTVFTVTQTLVKCMSGKTKWYTKADITYMDGLKDEFYVFYDVK
ncbi:MAG: hypothetical protein MSA07_10770 [Mucispirillum sp.]|uniref:Uncharacterized protein n=1 Tax=Candidatus Mucispirillum faecigallinarum TaxID=2838699 RepID=A0A9D2K9W2_9BACT|nr:hypothetical protein [Mucispirillum sp.]HIZ88699.1 hypothetical protein [Candidatus Mucispirillum faecigallinarum]